MAEVTIRDLRNQGGKVIDRVQAGEHLTVTRGGRPVAELRPLSPQAVPVETLLKRWSRLPVVDSRGLRSDLDRLLTPSL
jgi:prevent-host-death family protein